MWIAKNFTVSTPWSTSWTWSRPQNWDGLFVEVDLSLISQCWHHSKYFYFSDSPQSIKQSRINDRGFLPVGDSVFACYEDDFEDENDEEEEAPTTQTRSSADKEWEYVPSGIPNYRDSSAEHQSYFSAVATTSGIPSIVSSIWKVFSGSGDK